MVDFKQYEEAVIGKKTQCSVVSVEEGTQEEFRDDRYFEKMEEDKAKRVRKEKALKVGLSNGVEVVMALPKTKVIAAKSDLACWKKTYGDYPEIGQKVFVKIDENGRDKIVLER